MPPCSCRGRWRSYMQRAVNAEDELEAARKRIAALEDHLLVFVRKGNDPMLVTRAEVDEALLEEVIRAGDSSLVPMDLLVRIDAQLRAAAIFRRDGL